MKNKTFVLLIVLLLASIAPNVCADDAPTQIYTAEELIAIADDPAGTYLLMADIDMAGIAWQSLDFSGTFDGNGHSILNLTLDAPSDLTPDACDGNRVLYPSRYVGFFGTLQDATVQNLNLVNVRGCVESDEPCFVGAIAGYARNAIISDCSVSGTLELRAHDRIFGIGGIAGYGEGVIERCKVDVTLICVDTDPETRDEQFLGGAFAAGFFDVLDCDVRIDGYISEFGYVHSGGMGGMLMQYPLGQERSGSVRRNRIAGQITFFEHNSDRRAYCSPLFGEELVKSCVRLENDYDFKRNEIYRDTTERRPDMCEAPNYTETVTPALCDSFGFTTYTCTLCGHSYTDHYTLPTHTVSTWTIREAPTEEREGVSVGYCDLCGAEQIRIDPTLPPTEPTEQETEPPTVQTERESETAVPQPQSEPASEETPALGIATWVIAFAALLLLLLGAKMLFTSHKNKGSSD